MAALILLVPEVAAACPICFGAADSPMVDAARLGVIAMGTLTVSVLAVLGVWCTRLARWETEAQSASSHAGSIDPPSTVRNPQ
ncbi:MAG TPA: hypothetical protein VNJ04_21400 [Gemmatimonadaceae bacterium]|nr:hypothetical protein [Gemmatimonadaceae bacterium]